MEYKYGYFNTEGSEFIITDPKTPRPFDNLIWNDAIFSNVQQTGVGYCDYQIDKNEAVQLFTGIGRICDFDVFGRDHLMSRLVYIRDNKTGEFWNANWEPVKKEYENYECRHGMGYTTIRSTVNGVTSEFRIFIPMGSDPVELWSLKIINVSGKPRDISVFLYNQIQFKYKWGFDSYGDMIYRSVWLNREENALVATKHPFRRPHDYLTAYIASDMPIVAFDGSRDAFVGLYSTLAAPAAVVNGQCTNSLGSADATIGALQFNIQLDVHDEKEISIIVGATDSEEKIADVKNKYFGNYERYFEALKKDKEAMVAHNNFQTPDRHFNRILNSWVKQATLYGATWCRWGWNGYRDIVQHGLGVSVLEPERTRKILIEALGYQYSSGLALRGWNPVDEKSYSDSALWLVFTLVAYIKETGDVKILDEEVEYYDGKSGKVLEHIEQALNFLESNKGSHELILIKFGDWNDSLTGVGKEGRGESVWLSQAYAEAMLQMAELEENLGDDIKKLDYLVRREKIMSAINKTAWDGEWYLRCYDDNGNPIGSAENEFAQIFMESQSWALISGVANSERAETLIKACDRLLGTEMGYLLLAPPFTRVDENIGRISSMEPGIAENGTVYSHLNIWMIMGLLKYGMADKAYEIFKKVTPGYVNDENDTKQNCPPYMYANCYFGPDHKNNKFQMEFTWITGSVAWFNNVLLKEMLGAKAEYNGLLIDPCMPSEWEECKLDRHFRNAVYSITIHNPAHLQKGFVEIIVDGERLEGNLVPVFNDGGTHIVDVTMK